MAPDAPCRLPEMPSCPFCEQRNTELMSPFGSQLSVATYWCNACRSPFEVMKWRGSSAPEGAGK
jgi:3-hydroxybutyryl-CoA dehydrogenase